jgi:rhodanese-related sulfurtransferase
MKSITPIELQQLIDSKTPLQLLDVREPFEHLDFNIGGQLIPLNEVIKHIDEINKIEMVVLYCRKGIRSQIAIQKLQEKYPFKNLVNLIGGTEAWKKQILKTIE